MKYKILIGENNEKAYFKQFIKFRLYSLFGWLWRSKNTRILFSAFRRSRSKSCSVQEIGEIQ
ncbi:hypothetical protein CFT13S00388_09285 [Campylobacter fetus subsp. testudinum]|nr:hypothetical protein CFT13S00388_09285 [Campylobacter fetus subsp. testudinum]